MRTLPSEEALVAAYWRKLARSIEKPDVKQIRSGGSATRTAQNLRPPSRRDGAARSRAATEVVRRRARIQSNS